MGTLRTPSFTKRGAAIMTSSAANRWHDEVWTERYGHICPSSRGVIVPIHGVGTKDTYNPALFESETENILVFRCEDRKSIVTTPIDYHPMITFARPDEQHIWHKAKDIAPFEMMEDPFLFYVEERGLQYVVLGGVWVHEKHGAIIPHTEFYKGESLESLERIAFAVVDGMKDIRLLQLPDDRFLICRRPIIGNHRGRVTLHILDSLDELADIGKVDLPVLATLDSCEDALDWVGVNNLYMLKDSEGHAWVGLLGHVALEDHEKNLHYAVCTYRIMLQDLLANAMSIHKICPRIIAVRSCFEDGPDKLKTISDVVFPGHLQHLEGYHYRLWAGLSDTRIGCIEVDDPFGLQRINQ